MDRRRNSTGPESLTATCLVPHPACDMVTVTTSDRIALQQTDWATSP
jgi:hypothetical protein